jgi:hypothetical protein
MKMRLSYVLATAALAAACGGSDGSSTPPTAPATPSTAAVSGGTGPTSADGATTAASSVAVKGTISGLSGTCPLIKFTVEAKSVKADSATRFVDVKCADLTNGARVGVQGAAQSDGSVLAKAVMLLPPPAVITEGTVSALSGTCPAITFTVAGKTFTTDAQTRFGDGGCAAVKNDIKVAVATQTSTAGVVRVLGVKVIPPPPPPPVLTEGTVSGVSGTCPAITFTVAGKTFTTDAQTRFGALGCAAVKNEVKVAVATQTSPAGVVRVLTVKVIPPPPPPPVLTEGTVSALSGTCPAITFTVAGKTVTTDAQTRFGDGGCAAVKNDIKVAVATQTSAAGVVRVLAVKVILPPPPPPDLIGVVTALSGTCPNITITIGTKVAVTSATTVFSGKTCGDVKVGSKVGIYGTVAAGATTLTAAKVVIR